MNTTEPIQRIQPPTSGNFKFTAIPALVFLVALVVLLALRFLTWVQNMAGAIGYPGPIDYGEGIIWQQADMILRGDGYKDLLIAPHVVFHYPPVFHVTSGLLGIALNVDQLAAGRLVSTVSTFGIALIIGTLVYRAVRTEGDRTAAGLCGLIAGLLGFSCIPVAYWSATDRVDMLAIFLSLVGVYFGLKAPDKPIYTFAAAAFFVTAIFTKQTMFAAPIATFVVLLATRPRTAWTGLAVASCLGLAVLATLQYFTGGGFLQHVVGYNINRISLSNLNMLGKLILWHIVIVFIASLAALRIGTLVRKNLRSGHVLLVPSDFQQQFSLFAGAYFAISTVLLAAMLKSGSDINYALDWVYACTMLIGLAMSFPIRIVLDLIARFLGFPVPAGRAVRSLGRSLTACIVLPLLATQAFVLPSPPFPTSWENAEIDNAVVEMIERVRLSVKPTISDDMVATRKAGKEVFLEPAIIAELTALGHWDETAYVAMIKHRDFGFFVTKNSAGNALYLSRYSAAVRLAIETYYPRVERRAGYSIHLPVE